MIKRFLLLFLLITSAKVLSQVGFSLIDEKSKKVPDSLVSYQLVAKHLTRDLETEIDKARAVYIWVSHNIQYDLALINSDKRYDSIEQLVDETFSIKQGVCQHYAELFHAMCLSVGVKSYVISGYVRDNLGNIPDLAHAWNGIKIGSNYYLLDVTWAAGYSLNGKYIHDFRDEYFLKLPKEFIRDHMPFDPLYQFMDNPISNAEFIAGDFSKLNTKGSYLFNDLIDVNEKATALMQLEQSNKRIISNGVKNELIQKQIDENLYQITSRKYNAAAIKLNDGVNAYNTYVIHKNRRFRNPKLSDSRIRFLIDDAYNRITSANETFYALFSLDKKLSEMISITRKKLPSLISSVEKEKKFVDRYLKTWKPMRAFMLF